MDSQPIAGHALETTLSQHLGHRRLATARLPLRIVPLALASAAIRFEAGRRLEVPWIAPDESIYALLGRSLWETGVPSLVRDAYFSGYVDSLYPGTDRLSAHPERPCDLVSRLAQALGALAMSSLPRSSSTFGAAGLVGAEV